MAKAKASDDHALIAYHRLQIAKLTRELYGHRSERSVQLVDQMTLAFEELESSAGSSNKIYGLRRNNRRTLGQHPVHINVERLFSAVGGRMNDELADLDCRA